MNSLFDYILEKLNDAKNGDEFYTRLKDIERGLKPFDFRGKIVYCNCDNPEFSNFYKYFHDNFDKLGLKKLLCTYYAENPKLYVYDGKDEQKKEIESGEFQKNSEIMKQCDIVVTNPPYSNNMPVELIEMCIKNKKDYIFVGPLHLPLHKEAFELIKNEQLYSTPISINNFERPDGSNKKSPSCWWTNIYVEHPWKPTKEYDPDKYPKYDNYDAIECSTWKDIPKDYDGKMGVPYRFICNLNKDDYKILDIKRTMKLNGKTLGSRLVIEKKKASS